MKYTSAKQSQFSRRKASKRIVNAAVMKTLIVFLTVFTLVTPRDAMGFKKLFLGMSLVYGLRPIIEGLRRNAVVAVFALVLPILMYVVSSINTGSFTTSLSYLYPFVYLLLLFPIVEWNINIRATAIKVGKIMAVFIIVSCLLDSASMLDIYQNPVLIWLNANGEAKISKSVYAMFRYVIFFNASPILFFNLSESVKENDKAWLVLSFVALLLSGTRANIYLGTALLVFGMLFISKRRTSKVAIILGFLVVVVFFGSELASKYQIIAFAKSEGDSIRINGLQSILDTMNANRRYWLTGMGFGSNYYNSGRLSLLQTSELSYMEFIREAGLPLALLTFAFILYPLLKIQKTDYFILAPYVAYLAAGFFEPFIFTSTGFYVILMMYVECFKDREHLGTVFSYG